MGSGGIGWGVSDDLTLQTPDLSDAARQVLRVDRATAYRELVPTTGGSDEARAALQGLDAYKLTRTFPASAPAAEAALAGLWLWHDFLHESHEISQKIDNPTGAWWHGIMHRREGDFGNAKYWFRQVGDHVLHPVLAAHTPELLGGLDADLKVTKVVINGWDPMAFVDLCEHAHATGEHRAVAVALQHLEWRTLFDDCVRHAVN